MDLDILHGMSAGESAAQRLLEVELGGRLNEFLADNGFTVDDRGVTVSSLDAISFARETLRLVIDERETYFTPLLLAASDGRATAPVGTMWRWLKLSGDDNMDNACEAVDLVTITATALSAFDVNQVSLQQVVNAASKFHATYARYKAARKAAEATRTARQDAAVGAALTSLGISETDHEDTGNALLIDLDREISVEQQRSLIMVLMANGLPNACHASFCRMTVDDTFVTSVSEPHR